MPVFFDSIQIQNIHAHPDMEISARKRFSFLLFHGDVEIESSEDQEIIK